MDMNFQDFFIGVFVFVIGSTVHSAIVFVCLALFDTTIMERNAFAGTTACAVKRMEAKRKFLSSDVVCVPMNTRQDTTTVQVR